MAEEVPQGLKADLDGDGKVSFKESVQYAKSKLKDVVDEAKEVYADTKEKVNAKVACAKCAADLDGDGKVSKEEAKQYAKAQYDKAAGKAKHNCTCHENRYSFLKCVLFHLITLP